MPQALISRRHGGVDDTKLIVPMVSACVAVGLAFGVYPARQAATLDPVAALRSDG